LVKRLQEDVLLKEQLKLYSLEHNMQSDHFFKQSISTSVISKETGTFSMEEVGYNI
jgi:hypothetical protein